MSFKLARALYDWVLGLAEKPYASQALCGLSFAESSFFPIPPDVLLMPLCLGARKKAIWFATLCTVSSVIGGIAGYAIGYWLWWKAGGSEFSTLAQFFFTYVPGFSQEVFYEIQGLYNQYSFWIVFTAGFTPLPYKLITISSGAFGIAFLPFVVASLVGRAGRFYLVALLLYFFGPSMKVLIDKYFNLLASLFVALLIGGFLVLGFLK